MSSPPRGRIITFYSYKGGTGRTMALANAAWLLASNGFRVLMIDWDLEAPGLHCYFRPFLVDQTLASTKGVIDMVFDYQRAVLATENAESIQALPDEWYQQHVDLLSYVTELDWDQQEEFGELHLLPAGQQTASYGERVNSFNWRQLYDKLGGHRFIEAIRRQLLAEYDYILIDSRTGVSDTSGLCTVQLPDTLVVCFTLNSQSIEGSSEVALSVRAQRGVIAEACAAANSPREAVAFRILPVPMRVEMAEKHKLDAARTMARKHFDTFVSWADIDARERYWGDVEVLYEPFYAYEEVLAAVADQPGIITSMLASTERLISLIVGSEVRMPPMSAFLRAKLLASYERPFGDSQIVPVPRLEQQLSDTLERVIDAPAAQILVSCRRSDAAGHAARLLDRLAQWFDRGALFYDLDIAESGDRFPERIAAAVRVAGVVLVLIGPDWVAETNRRAALPHVDFVRVEVEMALQRQAAEPGLKVIPVLLGGAPPISLSDLDEGLRDTLWRLPSLDAHILGGMNCDWDEQFVALRALLASVPGVPTPRYRPSVSTVQHFQVIPHLLSRHFHDPSGALARVRSQLQIAQHAAIVAPAALYGMGGVGKTHLALKYSHEYRDSYAGVWWFRAENEATLDSDASEACLRTGAVIGQGERPTTAFTRWLQRQSQPWLLVFDNVEYDAERRQTTLPAACLQLQTHDVLITSRYPAWGGIAEAVGLTPWSNAEGAGFLCARLPHAQRADLERLSDVLGGLPLALEQAAAYLDECGISISEYCRLIEGLDTSALTLLEGRASTRYEHTVCATLSLSFQRLSPAAQALLRLCAFFSAEPIPERYFREGLEQLPAGLAHAAPSTLAWNKITGELHRFGIAARRNVPSLDGAAGQTDHAVEPSLVLHRLTLDVARHQLAVAAEDGPRAQRLLRGQCPADTNNPTQWARFTVLQPHLMQLDRLRSEDWFDRRAHSWMLDRVASYLQFGKALYPESERLCRAALELRRADLGEEHPDTLASMNNLALTLQDQGDLPAARELHEKTLAIRRRVLGEEHPDTLTSVNNLAATLWDLGDLPAARELHEKVLATYRRMLGEEHPHSLSSMNNLALTLRDQGDLPAARALHEKTLAIRRRVLGDVHPSTLISMSNLAGLLQAQGDLPAARELYEKTLATLRRVLGEEHPHTLTSMNNLAQTLQAQGDLPAARALHERALTSRRRVLGEEHPDTLASMNNLSTILRDQGDLPAARALEEQVLTSRRRVLGEEHSHTLASLNSLAETLSTQGEPPAVRNPTPNQ